MAGKVLYQIETRKQVMVNTDPHRRCYDGCNFSEELRWTEPTRFGRYTKEDGEGSIATFQSINPKDEYKLVPITEDAS